MTSINFSSLLAINQKYRPAEVTQIVPRDIFQPPTNTNTKSRKQTTTSSIAKGSSNGDGGGKKVTFASDLESQHITEESETDVDANELVDDYYEWKQHPAQPQHTHEANASSSSWKEVERKTQRQSQIAKDVAHALSLQTPICASTHAHLRLQHTNDQMTNHEPNHQIHPLIPNLANPHHGKALQGERIRLHELRKENEAMLAPSFHQVELEDWEDQIDWEGCTKCEEDGLGRSSEDGNVGKGIVSKAKEDTKRKTDSSSSSTKPKASSDPSAMDIDATTEEETIESNITTIVTTKPKPRIRRDAVDAETLLSTPLNPFVDAMDFTKYISWEGMDAPRGFNASLVHPTKSPLGQLVLQQGVAGTSIAKMTGLTSSTSSLPLPFSQSEHYQNRILGKSNAASNASGGSSGGGGGSLQKNKEDQERQIAHNQKKRAEMAIEKTNRVNAVLNTLQLGGGRGRTITSSLMGPGGTERTGRPSRLTSNSSLAHDSEYVEQLEMIYNHTLVKPFELSRAELRHFHRPKLPRRFFFAKDIMPFQFQIRVFPQKDGGKGRRDGRGDSRSSGMNWNQNSMMNIPGAISQTKIKNEADLTPADGDIILIEYSEERPPLQLAKGMACRVVNYYRGDKSKCPISVGGGDRPTRKKKHTDKSTAGDDGNARGGGSTGKLERPPRLIMESTTASNLATDLIGKIGEKKKENGDDSNGAGAKSKNEASVKLLPEGVTEILHSKAHGPFIGAVKDGVTQTGLINNLFAAPMFRHDPNKTDFLMILGKKPNTKQYQDGPLKLNVALRSLPSSVFTVGQTEPRVKVFAPGSNGEKGFLTPFSVYQIAKLLQRTRQKEDRGLKFDEIIDGLFSNTERKTNVLRGRIKQVAIYDKNTHIWTLKEVGPGTDETTFPGVEALGRGFTPEGVAAYESARAAVQRLEDLGIQKLPFLTNNVGNLSTAMTYLHGIISAARERKSEMAKMARTQSKTKNGDAYALAEKKLEAIWKELKRKGEVARFILEELQLAPWNLSSEFIDVHKHGLGTAMMKLTGLGDPSGVGAAYNFLRESDSKPNKVKTKNSNDSALNARIKKITGTENDLRKLTMKQMEKILLSYGMAIKDIKTLKRWDRVHCIRDLSTKAASDNMGDGLERFAREEKLKLSEQKKMYKERIQEIWERQRQTLSTDAGKLDVNRTSAGTGPEGGVDKMALNASEKGPDALDEKEESDDAFDEDDFFAEFEDEENTNQLMRQGMLNESGSRRFGAMNDGTEDSKKDARELAAWKRQNEEERAVQVGLDSESSIFGSPTIKSNKKVIRRKIVKTHPDGNTEVRFKFIVLDDEVKDAMAKLKKKEEEISIFNREKKGLEKSEQNLVRPNKIGHALFEDDDDMMDYKIHVQVKRRRGGRRKNAMDDSPSRGGTLRKSLTKSQTKLTKKQQSEKKMKKRKRDAEEKDLYISNAKRMGTSNRKERKSLRDRMPHVIMADRLEQIRLTCEKRPGSIAFHRPVDKRAYSKYYEVISNPIDLQTISNKIARYAYNTAEQFVKDFELMKQNAIKFNGIGHTLSIEATSIYEFVRNTVIENRDEFNAMELAVSDQLNSSKKKKGSRSSTPKNVPDDPTSNTATGQRANVTLDGVTTTILLGNSLGNLKSAYDGASESDSSG